MAHSSLHPLSSPFPLSGTGKTLTVIEAILQICRHHPEAKVLAVAPSDVAADILAERLAQYMTPTQLFRLNWYQVLRGGEEREGGRAGGRELGGGCPYSVCRAQV